METFTLVHVILSIVGIISGVLVVGGLMANRRFNGWTEVFLVTTVATNVTGFGFPFTTLLPSHIVGGLSLLILALVIVALYVRRLEGSWRWVYVVGSVTALYLNVFVLIVQLFLKVPAMTALAPTQGEPGFAATQILFLALFVAIGRSASARFRN
jgi:uncharacterized membrane-anchored protein